MASVQEVLQLVINIVSATDDGKQKASIISKELEDIRKETAQIVGIMQQSKQNTDALLALVKSFKV